MHSECDVTAPRRPLGCDAEDGPRTVHFFVYTTKLLISLYTHTDTNIAQFSYTALRPSLIHPLDCTHPRGVSTMATFGVVASRLYATPKNCRRTIGNSLLLFFGCLQTVLCTAQLVIAEHRDKRTDYHRNYYGTRAPTRISGLVVGRRCGTHTNIMEKSVSQSDYSSTSSSSSPSRASCTLELHESTARH